MQGVAKAANGRTLKKLTYHTGRVGYMKEIWKDIKGYEGLYQISNFGNVKSLERKIISPNGVVYTRRERIMAKRESTDGYYIAKLNVNKHSKSIAIHILVAEHFLPNPNNYPEVNHLDCNRKNNRADNLEWCTHQYNVQYSKLLGHYKGKTGKDNPNYNNHTLREKYKNNPELAKLNNQRPREQNGRCIPIRVYHKNGVTDFRFIGEAAEYLIENGYTHNQINVIRNNITKSIKNNKLYLGCKFEKI